MVAQKLRRICVDTETEEPKDPVSSRLFQGILVNQTHPPAKARPHEEAQFQYCTRKGVSAPCKSKGISGSRTPLVGLPSASLMSLEGFYDYN